MNYDETPKPLSELGILMFSLPPAPVPKQARQVFQLEMRKIFRQAKVPHRDSAYGTVQPRVLEYLKTVDKAEPNQIGAALGLNNDSVRRGIRALHRKKLIVCVRPGSKGSHIPSLWKAAEGNS